jgi:hypothetical protein
VGLRLLVSHPQFITVQFAELLCDDCRWTDGDGNFGKCSLVDDDGKWEKRRSGAERAAFHCSGGCVGAGGDDFDRFCALGLEDRSTLSRQTDGGRGHCHYEVLY